MRRPTRPFTVEPESRRKLAQGSVSDENGGALIDEPAPEEVPSRDVNEDAPASGGDDTPFAANGVLSTIASDTPPTAVSLGESSSGFAPQQAEPSEPSPAAPDEPLEGERVPPSPVPASASVDTRPENRDSMQTERAPRRGRRTPTRSLAHEEHAPDRDQQAAESARPAMMLEEQVSVAAPSAPAQDERPVPDGPKLTRRRAEARVPAGER